LSEILTTGEEIKCHHEISTNYTFSCHMKSDSNELNEANLFCFLLINRFPGLEKNIFGEESNEFTNDLGEKITLRLCSTEEETAELLSKVLNGNKVASEALARVVHQDVAFTDPTLDSTEINVPQDILGIWVDPIDSTYQYIKGSADIKSNQGIFPCGLQCVTILIGVYDIQTGVPLMGVINQPFVSRDPNTLR
uniref:inositol-1,4-bisphosphate 1-phosphatase n=1 Tax=Rhinopithecus bieti TaxID=61621 RepID=A0A2K6L2J9_RHIBE